MADNPETGGAAATTPAALPRDDGGPVFDRPWQAQAQVLAQTLLDRGLVSSHDWSAALGRELRRQPDQAVEPAAPGDPRAAAAEHYFRAVLRALERVSIATGATSEAELAGRADAWRRAYLNTPHGQPVRLARPGGGAAPA